MAISQEQLQLGDNHNNVGIIKYEYRLNNLHVPI